MKNREPLIQIFSKAPMLGKVKTRLVQKLGARGALDLYQQMFERLISELTASRFNTELWISPDKAHVFFDPYTVCLLYTSPSPRDVEESRMPSSA